MGCRAGRRGGLPSLTLVLLAFGAGMGFSVVSPWANSGVTATTFKVGAGLYFIVMAMISSGVGGYLAGRFRTKWVGVNRRGAFPRYRLWLPGVGCCLCAGRRAARLSRDLPDWRNARRGDAGAATPQISPMSGYVDTLLRPNNPSA